MKKLMSLGAALRKADQSENAELTSQPRSPFSSSKFNSEIIVEHTDNDTQEITTIDWDCLKSVIMNTASNSIDIRIPDSAVMQKYKIKQKQLKTGAKASDDSQLRKAVQNKQNLNVFIVTAAQTYHKGNLENPKIPTSLIIYNFKNMTVHLSMLLHWTLLEDFWARKLCRKKNALTL